MAREERSAGFVVYISGSGDEGTAGFEFLILNYGQHWDFPKGHLEKSEDDYEAAVREVREETGLHDLQRVNGFCREVSYFFRTRKHGLVHKRVAFFLGRTRTREITLSSEHVGYEFLTYPDALRRLTFPTAKNVLRFAEQHLRSMEA